MSILEKDCVLGSFSNTTKYIELLEQSVAKFLPNILAIRYIGDGPVNVNMAHMREEFIKTGKRYWIYCDHDIQFLNSSIVLDALTTLVSNKGVGLVTVYSSHNPEYLERPYNAEGLTEGIIPWSIGYFMLVDSDRTGDIIPDMTLPSPNYAIDVSFSIEVRRRGWDIAVSPNYVYHLNKGKQDDSFSEVTKEYFIKKYGQFYLNCYQPVSLNLA